MPHYSEEFKEKLVREMMSPGGRSVSEIHRASGISENRLFRERRTLVLFPDRNRHSSRL
uniref:Transposase n=1 Tax=Candidatus Kentrum sp. TUN TaxID=2126343 RepID=A0A451AGM5_9GAMM|nr:MAG: Transposase [Candidatus Kentron sp. TUN]